MKSFFATTLTALFAQQVASHATFQQLWVNGVDQISLYFYFLGSPALSSHERKMQCR